jgi:hypothetical protein
MRTRIYRRTGTRDLAFGIQNYFLKEHKVPPTYSRAEDGARSLYAAGMTLI